MDNSTNDPRQGMAPDPEPATEGSDGDKPENTGFQQDQPPVETTTDSSGTDDPSLASVESKDQAPALPAEEPRTEEAGTGNNFVPDLGAIADQGTGNEGPPLSSSPPSPPPRNNSKRRLATALGLILLLVGFSSGALIIFQKQRTAKQPAETFQQETPDALVGGNCDQSSVDVCQREPYRCSNTSSTSGGYSVICGDYDSGVRVSPTVGSCTVDENGQGVVQMSVSVTNSSSSVARITFTKGKCICDQPCGDTTDPEIGAGFCVCHNCQADGIETATLFPNQSSSVSVSAPLSTGDCGSAQLDVDVDANGCNPWEISYLLWLSGKELSECAAATPTPTPTGALTPTPTSTLTPTPTPTVTPTPTLTPTPTGTPPPCDGECLDLVPYVTEGSSWATVSPESYSQLEPGDELKFVVTGQTQCPDISLGCASGPTKARFRILVDGNLAPVSEWCTGTGNTTDTNEEWCETTNLAPIPTTAGTLHYYVSYVLPSVSNYRVEAMIYCPAIGWK